MSLRLRRTPPTPPEPRYEARFHRTLGPHKPADDYTWHVRKIYPHLGAVTNFDPQTAESYKAARDAATAFIEHQRKIDGTPWEEL